MGICTHSVNKSNDWTCRKGAFIVMQMVLKDLQRKRMLSSSGCNMRFETPAVDHATVPQIVSVEQTANGAHTSPPYVARTALPRACMDLQRKYKMPDSEG